MAEEHTDGTRLDISALSVVNYALQQNRVPVIRCIRIFNDSDGALENVELKITASPALCLPYSKHLSYIAPRAAFRTEDVALLLDGEYLAGLTEKATATLSVSLWKEDTRLCGQDLEITALAYDEWSGYGIYPELLAAFVTPNHPEIVKLTARAADLLVKWTGDPSLDGYQTQDPNRVLFQAAAVYGAIQERNLVYSVPPASFEPAGQRVRLCDAVMQQKLGTCLDLTLLYAGCLEAIGLHPLLILKSGHIFAGLWLEELTFPESVQDDVSLLTKRLADGIREIAVVECTAVTAGKNMSFDEAQAAAEQQLTGENAVEYVIDVHRARLSGVSPLPLRVATETGWVIQRPTVKEHHLTDAPQAIRADSLPDLAVEQAAPPKRVQWERKLLDLGMRNTLINMRLSKSMVPILTASLDELENALAGGSDFTILPRPADTHVENGIQLDTIHQLQSNPELIASEFKSGRLRAAYTDAELTKSLKDLYRAAKTAMEENGANTLYLALGLLRWYESERSTKARYAPIVLLPVEMVRKSAAQGYVIRLRDDDAQMNITMLEKLKQDFGITVNGLDPLPMDEHGVDIRRVFTVVRKAVMNQNRWDVLESACLGIFSFSQFVMWNDIRNRSDALSRNKIVRSLMDGKLCWDAQDMEIGDKVPEDGVYLPLSADASQLFAIEKACQGESFVLHGPPGTGKSQTITTMIANALAQGKTVLFVAEKMAALEVVQRRLDKIGIGPFCLELHSNKSKKRDVLDQLRLATEVTKTVSPEEYAARASQIAGLRQELDAYAGALHHPGAGGKSLFELVDLYEQNRNAPDLPPFSPEFAESLDSEALLRQDAAVERLVASAKAVGHPSGHPLENVCRTQYSQQLRAALPDALSRYEAALENLKPSLTALGNAIDFRPSSYQEISEAAELCGELKKWFDLPNHWARQEDPSRSLADAEEMVRHAVAAETQKQRLSQNWNEDFLTQDGKSLCDQWDSASGKWLLPRITGQNGIVRRVSAFARSAVSKETLREQLGLLAAYQSEKAAADTLLAACADSLGTLYRGGETDYSAVSQAVETARNSLEALRQRGGDHLRLTLAEKPGAKDAITEFLTAWNALLPVKDGLYNLLALSCDPASEDYVNQQLTLCGVLRDQSAYLKDWIAFNAVAEDAARLGLGDLVDAYRGGLPHTQVQSAYRKAISKAMAMVMIDASEALRTFSGAVFDEKVRQFRRLDAHFTDLTQKEIYCRLASKVPNFTKEAAHSSELGILQRAIRSGGRGVSIRRLFEQIPNLLPRLCPCMLMSPISAAQYLEPNRTPFDLVVFDEASQLPTCKAVGALARGENAVIVGDPKQMPPTAFFVTNTVDEENLESEDLESILDDCLALNIPQTHLLWHYRSRHESLIAFSNRTFYENKLYTFPSTNDRASKVHLIHVDGVFERSKQRQNHAEALAVIDELKRRCYDPVLSKQSVGVVTFNISQQNLIDDLLSDACRDDPNLDAWAYQSAEPVFIKNLENVQGDERDVILFSIGYGPDENGKVYMNFGPLNRDGGWRRLNVAITRARQEMIVFATLKPEQIDLSRTTAQGVSALKAFLEYADTKRLPQDEHTAQKRPSASAGVVESIRAFLAENGYATELNVGHSEYRIDIGVIDPQNPEQYLLGILLDGGSYGAAKTTRDREIAQIGVLNGLGWRIVRVWTMDWWDNRDRELARLQALLSAPPSDVPSQPSPPELPAVKPTSEQRLSGNVSKKKPSLNPQTYQAASLKEESVSAEEFLLPRYAAAIRKKILLVLSREAPVSGSLLTRRVVQSYGITRAGSRIQTYLEQMYRSLGLKTTQQGEEVFYWGPEQDPETYLSFRTGQTEQTRREAKDIPVQEAAGAAIQALTEQISLSDEDLLREAGKLLGYPRTGSAIAGLLREGIRYAQWKNRITVGANGNWTLTGEN